LATPQRTHEPREYRSGHSQVSTSQTAGDTCTWAGANGQNSHRLRRDADGNRPQSPPGTVRSRDGLRPQRTTPPSWPPGTLRNPGHATSRRLRRRPPGRRTHRIRWGRNH